MNTPNGTDNLPLTLLGGAQARGNEWGWAIESFPIALAEAPRIGYACLGGQFQILLEEGVCEMYWLSADSQDRFPNEPWQQYAERSCDEVAAGFQQLTNTADFNQEASTVSFLKARVACGWDVRPSLLFVAYFATEAEYESLTSALPRERDRISP